MLNPPALEEGLTWDVHVSRVVARLRPAMWEVFQATCIALAHDGVYGVFSSGFIHNGLTFQLALVRQSEAHPLAVLETRIFDDAAPASAQRGLRLETYLWTQLEEAPALVWGAPCEGVRRYHASYEDIVREAATALDSAVVAQQTVQRLAQLGLLKSMPSTAHHPRQENRT